MRGKLFGPKRQQIAISGNFQIIINVDSLVFSQCQFSIGQGMKMTSNFFESFFRPMFRYTGFTGIYVLPSLETSERLPGELEPEFYIYISLLIVKLMRPLATALDIYS